MDTNPTALPPAAPDVFQNDAALAARRPSLSDLAAIARQHDARRDADTRLLYARSSRAARRRLSGD
jgi:hypothetical protein